MERSFAGEFYIYGCLFDSWKISYSSFCFADIIYFIPIFTWLLQYKGAIFIKSSLLCESFHNPLDTGHKLNVLCTFNLHPMARGKCAHKSKFLLSISEAILIYWLLKNIFFTFYERHSATFKFSNRLNQIS